MHVNRSAMWGVTVEASSWSLWRQRQRRLREEGVSSSLLNSSERKGIRFLKTTLSTNFLLSPRKLSEGVPYNWQALSKYLVLWRSGLVLSTKYGPWNFCSEIKELIFVMKTDLMHCLYLIYFVRQPIHVSGVFNCPLSRGIHCICTEIGTCYAFRMAAAT
jgi:hypothetical protein